MCACGFFDKRKGLFIFKRPTAYERFGVVAPDLWLETLLYQFRIPGIRSFRRPRASEWSVVTGLCASVVRHTSWYLLKTGSAVGGQR